MHFKEKGKRVFNIKFGNEIIVKNLDIFANIGHIAAYDEYIEFVYVDGLILFNGKMCPHAINPNTDNLVVTFEKINIDNPKVDGIILFKGGIEGFFYL